MNQRELSKLLQHMALYEQWLLDLKQPLGLKSCTETGEVIREWRNALSDLVEPAPVRLGHVIQETEQGLEE